MVSSSFVCIALCHHHTTPSVQKYDDWEVRQLKLIASALIVPLSALLSPVRCEIVNQFCIRVPISLTTVP